MKKIISAMLVFASLLGILPGAVCGADDVLYDFETGKAEGFTLKSGEAGKVVTDRRKLFNDGRMINKAGNFFFSTLDAEDGTADDTMKCVYESGLFNVNKPYLSFMLGGGNRDGVYVEIVSADGSESLKIRNRVASQNMYHVTEDVSRFVGKRAFIRLVDNSSDYYGFLIADDFRLVSDEASAGSESGSSSLFYSDFSDGNIPAEMTNTGSWFVGPDPDNNLCLQTKTAGGMSSLITVGDNSWTDYIMKFTVKALKLGTGSAVHANFRMQGNENNCYRVVITANGNVSVRLVKDGAYGDTTICSGMISDINSENTIEVRASSALIELYINGVKAGEGSNNTYTSGGVSFGTWAMLGAFDNIEIRKTEKVINVQSITLPYTELNLNVGDTLIVTPDIKPSDATVKTVKYISRNLDCVTITPDGVLRAVAPGEALLVVRTNDGNYEAECNITVSGKSFADMENHWAKEDVEILASQKIINGKAEDRFDPDSNITNREAMALAERMKDGFKTKYTLSPDENTTREQFFALAGEVYKYISGLRETTGNFSAFSDAPADMYKEDASVLCGLKIIQGNDEGLLNPGNDISRAEAAKILSQIKDKLSFNELGIYENDYKLGFGLRNDKHFKLYEPGEAVAWYVRADGKTSNSFVEVDIVNCQNDERTSHKIELTGDVFETEKAFIPTENGVYKLNFTYVTADGTAKDAITMQIGVAPKADGVADDYFYFGVQPHISFAYTRPHWDHNYEGLCYNETFDLSFDLMEWLGVNVIREGPAIIADKAAAAEPSENWKWGYTDDVFERISENGMTFDLILNNRGTEVMEKYKSSASSWDAIPKTTESILDVTGKVIDRYADKYNDVKIIYEFGNESNYPSYFSGTEDEYVEQLGAFARYVRSKDPDALISSSGIVVDGPKDENIYYKGISELRDENLIDLFAYHSHGSFDTYLNNRETVKGYASTAKLDIDGIAFLNETGMDLADKEEQVNQVIRKLLCAMGNNHRGVVAFKLRQYPEIATPGGMGGYAMIGNKGDVRELFIGYSTMIRMLNNTKSVEQLSDDDVFAYSFVKENEEIVAVFCEDNVKGAKISLANNDYVVYNIYGNEIEKSGEYDISKEPLYFKVKNSDSVKINYAG